MASSTNAWYSIQNFGNDYFLGCNNVGNCGIATSGLADESWFQLAQANGAYYIRPKAVRNGSNGETYCVNINTGVPAVASCSNQSAIWGISNWNGQNASDGEFFFSLQRGDSQRLSLSNNLTYSLLNYAGLPVSNQVLMQWDILSRAAINDQTYSTVPAGIIGGSATTTTASTNSTVTSSSAASPTSPTTITGATGLGPASTITSVNGGSTVTMVITPTVTAPNSGASRTSTSSISPTVMSAGHKQSIGIKTVLALTVVLPQVLWLWA